MGSSKLPLFLLLGRVYQHFLWVLNHGNFIQVLIQPHLSSNIEVKALQCHLRSQVQVKVRPTVLANSWPLLWPSWPISLLLINLILLQILSRFRVAMELQLLVIMSPHWSQDMLSQPKKIKQWRSLIIRLDGYWFFFRWPHTQILMLDNFTLNCP